MSDRGDTAEPYDFVVVGSGFGGSVSALRLVEKGYRVLLLEKGPFFTEATFPRTNWNLRRWLWLPALGFRGPFCMSFFRHVTVLSGVGVGGGSLVYANTLARPEREFFRADSWAELADWEQELAPHYDTVRRMLGATPTPFVTTPDRVLHEIAAEDARPDACAPTEVGVFFGEPGRTVADPYHGGEGPPRTGCIMCGGCMLGCRFGAKNTLDRNYLHLARARGLQIIAEAEVTWVAPAAEGGYAVQARLGRSRLRRRTVAFRASNVVLAAGVLGTLSLLHRMRARADGLPHLSTLLGRSVRTNSEAIVGIISRRKEDLSRGIAIGSILSLGGGSHAEPVRYPEGAGFFRLLMAPHVEGRSVASRVLQMLLVLIRHPIRWLRAVLVRDLSRATTMLLFMRRDGSKLRFSPRRGGGLRTALDGGPPPSASIPEASALARRIAHKLDATPVSLLPETLFNVPTTAHILGGCSMGASASTGVIDSQHRVFGYPGLYVVDGSAISADPGVNPALTIAALAERAMSFVPEKGSKQGREAGGEPRQELAV